MLLNVIDKGGELRAFHQWKHVGCWMNRQHVAPAFFWYIGFRHRSPSYGVALIAPVPLQAGSAHSLSACGHAAARMMWKVGGLRGVLGCGARRAKISAARSGRNAGLKKSRSLSRGLGVRDGRPLLGGDVVRGL